MCGKKLYTPPSAASIEDEMNRLYRASLLALYQLSIFVGILLLPLALGARRLGIPLPIHRVIDRLETAVEMTDDR